MSDLKKNLLKEILSIVIGLVPGGGVIKGAVSTEIAERLTKQEVDIIEKTARRIFDNLYESVGLDSQNPGAAKSAAYDVVATIKAASLSGQTLVDCCLDPSLLYGHLLKFPAKGIEYASGLRKDLYHAGLRQFASDLSHLALKVPFVEWLAQRQILLNQQKILELAEKSLKGADDEP